MRVILLGVILTMLGVFQVSAQCNYQIELYDTWGDGFNGGTVTVLVNDVAVLTGLKIDDGKGPEVHSFIVNDGDNIEISYTPGDYSDENEIRIYNAEEILIYEDGADGVVPTGGTLAATCPTCPRPTDIIMLNRTLSSLEVGWTDENASLWNIEYGAKGFTLGSGTEVTNLTSKSYLIENLDEFTEYDVYVKSDCASDGTSIWRKAEFLTLAPCWIPNISYFNNTTETSFDVTWNETGTATVWDVEYVLETEDFTGLPTVTDITNNTYTISGLDPYTSYKIKVRASCGNGEFSEWSSTSYKTTLPTCKIPSFGNSANIAQTSAELNWTENGDATEWEIELIKATESFTETPTHTAITTKPYLVQSLEMYTEYKYRIRANCGGGDVSPWGLTYNFITLPNYPIPEINTIDNVTVISADISWIENGTASLWDVELIEDSESFTGTPTDTDLNVMVYSPVNLQTATKYKVRVRANMGNGEVSPWSEASTFITKIDPISNGSCGIDYNIYDLEINEFPIGVLNEGVLGTDLQLKAVNIVIEHTWDSDLIISLKSPGGQEVLLSSENGSSGENYGDPTSACLSYTSFTMSGLDGNITDASAPFIGSYNPEGDFSDFNDDVTNAKGTWVLEIEDDASGDEGSIIYAELIFEDLTPTSIIDSDSTFGDKLKVYPNPASEYLFVDLDLENSLEDIHLALTELSGKQVYKKQYSASSGLKERIDLSNLNKGLYFLSVNTVDKNEVVKVIVK